MNTLGNLRRDTPPMKAEAEAAARARLLAAMREPQPRPRRTMRLGLRLAAAGTLAVALGVGVVVVRDQPRVVTVSSVEELGERAAQAAYANTGMVPISGKWLYIKEVQAPAAGEAGNGVDLSKRENFEQWTSVDGRQIAWRQPNGELLVQGNSPGIGTAELSEQPVTPEGVLAKVRREVEKFRERRVIGMGSEELSLDEELFSAVSQLMSTQALPPEVRAALFRALPTIPGVSIRRDVTDASGRVGIAFSHTGWARYDLILDPVDFQYLGKYGEITSERRVENGAGNPPTVYRPGTPVVLTSRVETKVVDTPGLK
ncbi:CU044_5270 family protein [Sinosporangium siamense]|uniref:CU044_5270 family protein n=1 Tax=Sinosporangium siamense TaxID=1367973 RepID=A0A919VAQ8_9ACTN|nr:CU044_5270 family protein [Sinosporangium siamense]GII96736.1 hypothetical protein Ssi02_69670 [Sinosporangium siamense]